MCLGLGEPLIAHQPALGFADLVAFLNRGASLRQFGPQRFMRAETPDRDLQNRTNTGGGQALDDIGGDPGLQCCIDLFGRAALRKQNHRARFIAVQRPQGYESVSRRIIEVTDDDIGLAGTNARCQVSDIGRNRHDDTASRFKPQSHRLSALSFAIHQ